MSSGVAGPLVQLVEGSLLGRTAESVWGGVKYNSFQGIPYAQPPIGTLRFMPPQPVKPWTGVREALKEGSKAPATDFASLELDPASDEDCLYLNVYTKQLTGRQPVLLFIHGGAFIAGSGNTDIYGPDYLLTKDVVLVTINYRLGALGFLSLQDEICPGNNGLRDQVEALKWTQRNISSFGGDPDNVTIFGESAGGAAVQFLMLSPLSKGLFHRAISQSGTVLTPWALARHPVECAFALGEALGLKTKDKKALFEFLKTVSPSDLVSKSKELLRKVEPESYFLGSIPFIPVVEPNFPGAFLSRNPIELLHEGKVHDVPYILGVNTLEGPVLMNAGDEIAEPKTKEEWERLLPVHPNVKRGTPLADSILEKIKDYYFASGFTKERYADVLSWLYFFAGNDEVLQSLSNASTRKSKTYFYHFTFEGSLALFKALRGFSHWKGTFHGDELSYLFWGTMMAPTVTPGSDEDAVINIMTGLWSDFAKTGNPTPISGTWKQYTGNKEEYLDISAKLVPKEKLIAEEAELWRSIFSDISKATTAKIK